MFISPYTVILYFYFYMLKYNIRNIRGVGAYFIRISKYLFQFEIIKI